MLCFTAGVSNSPLPQSARDCLWARSDTGDKAACTPTAVAEVPAPAQCTRQQWWLQHPPCTTCPMPILCWGSSSGSGTEQMAETTLATGPTWGMGDKVCTGNRGSGAGGQGTGATVVATGEADRELPGPLALAHPPGTDCPIHRGP